MPNPTVDKAVTDIRQHMSSGWFDPVSHDDIRAVANTLKGLNASDTRDALQQLSDAELKSIADEVNDDAWFGNGGLSQGEKTDFFNEMARDLGGADLARLAQGFDRTQGRQTSRDRLLSDDNIAALGRAAATHASDATKVDFVRALAGQSTDQSRIQTMYEDRLYDPQARAIAEVIGGLRNNPVAAEQALEALTPQQMRAVVNASTREQLIVGGGAMGGGVGAVRTDTSAYTALMKTVAGIGDADTQARLFDAAAAEMQDLQSRGRGDAAADVRRGMTEVLLSNTNGVLRELAYNTETANGKAFAQYAKAMLNAGEAGTLGEVQARLLLGNDKNAADPVARFEATVAAPSGEPRKVNAEVAGYFAGAVTAAARSISSDARQQAELVTSVLKSALAVVDKAGVGGRVGGGVASVAKEWVQYPVRAAMDALVAGRIDAADAMVAAMQPTRETARLPNGLPDTELGVGSAARSAFQSTWSWVVERARP